MGTTTFTNILNGAVAYPFVAGSTIEAGQIVAFGTDGKVDKATASASNIIGVAANDATLDEDVSVVVSGPAQVQVAAINFTSETQFNCTADANGRAVPVSVNGQYLAVRLIPGTLDDLTYAAGDLCLCVIATGTAHA